MFFFLRHGDFSPAFIRLYPPQFEAGVFLHEENYFFHSFILLVVVSREDMDSVVMDQDLDSGNPPPSEDLRIVKMLTPRYLLNYECHG
jgi:hypothetical protein